MDVSFTNVLEGARQYFQGLPAATGSSASPAYPTGEPHTHNSNQTNERTSTTVSYWPPHQESQIRTVVCDRTSIEHVQQRPPSHHGDLQQKPSTHHADMQRPSSHNGEMQRPPSQHSEMQRPHSHHSEMQRPSSHHNEMQRPPSHHSEMQRPSSHHSETQRPPSHHSEIQRHSSHHSEIQRPPSHHSEMQRPPSHHSEMQRIPSQHSEMQRPPSHHSEMQRIPSHHSEMQIPPSHHGEMQVPPSHHGEIQRPSPHPTEVQRPPSHPNEIQRPSSQNFTQEQTRVSNYQSPYTNTSNSQFQFARPHSRDISTQQYASHILPNPTYHQQYTQQQSQQHQQQPQQQQHQQQSQQQHQQQLQQQHQQSQQQQQHQQQPQQQHQQSQQQHQQQSQQQHQQQQMPQQQQQQRIRQEQLTNSVPSYHQLQPVQNTSQHHSQTYPTYTQSRSYYQMTSQIKTSAPMNNYKVTSTQSYSQPTNENTYKTPYPQHSQNHYLNHKGSTANSSETKNTSNNASHQNVSYSQANRTTHNLPPIAALSSVNYHSNRNSRSLLNNRPARATVVPTSSSDNITNHSSQQHQYLVQNSQEYRNEIQLVHSSKPSFVSNNYYQTTTTTTTTHPIASSSRGSNVIHQATMSVNSQSSNVSNYQPVQKNPTTQQAIQNNLMPNQFPMKPKRESPLDLSVKTVRTSADSTLDDTEEAQRMAKYYSNNRSTISQSSTQQTSAGYPTYDMYPTAIQKNLSSRSHIQSVSAPKVDFNPNFNVPSLKQPNVQTKNYKIESRKTVQPSQQTQINYDKNYPRMAYAALQQSNNTQRYQNSSITPSVHNNVYSVPQVRRQMDGLPRIDFPPSEHGHKSPAIYPVNSHEINKKRVAEPAPSMIPTKVPKVDIWKQTIDQQIEQKLSSYVAKMQQDQKQQTTTKQLVNGNYPTQIEKTKENYSSTYHRSQYQTYQSTNQYPTHHNQTYVPSAVAHQYPGYTSSYGSQQTYTHHSQYHPQRTNLNPPVPITNTNRTNIGGAADKRVLSLLRNSLEIKGAKEAQRKLEQDQINNKNYDLHNVRHDVQQPSTDVTAPLQPKSSTIGRHNVSPFTAASLLERNSNTPPYKFHFPKAMDSVKIENELNKNSITLNDKQMTGNTNADLDGLAAFLAARIRTKAELKQVGSTQNMSNNNTNHLPNNSNEDIRINTECSMSSSKVTKDRTYDPNSPRRKLFTRIEEENITMTGTVIKTASLPPREKSGMRSSSETSVFDFPDSDSEIEMPVLERQSLEDMRRDRKSNFKPLLNDKDIKLEPDERTSSPFDNMFNDACDNFMEQLKKGSGKKRGRRKKGNEFDDSIIFKGEDKKLEIEVEIKTEVLEETTHNSTNVVIKQEVNHHEDSDSDVPLIQCKPKVPKLIPEKTNDIDVLKKEVEGTSDSSDVESQPLEITKDTTPKKGPVQNELDNKINEINQLNKFNSFTLPANLWPKPGKKPTFGDGSDFYPGWEEALYRYKRSLRMPASLIHVTRPPNCQRLSTSLPDLDPCPISPSPSSIPDNSIEYNTKLRNKLKNEILDSDSNSSFNFSFNKTNYDSEGSSSVKSLNVQTKPKEQSILDKLLERYGTRKRRRNKKRDELNGPKIIPKAESEVELLPTPSLEIKAESKAKIINSESVLLGFRKKTVENFKDAFIKNNNSMVGVTDKFTTVIFKSRTRKQTRVLKQKATIREVFGEDRPASAPPVTCLDDLKQKELEIDERKPPKEDNENNAKINTKEVLKCKLINKSKKQNNLLKDITSKRIKIELPDDNIDTKSESASLDGDDTTLPNKKRAKLRNIRRKFSSGFDYIRKKKKQVKKENIECENNVTKPKRRGITPKASPESVQDIQREIKTWVLNKGIGETHLHRAARLGYSDVTAYCLEKMNCSPSPKDNAGYTPLHEACSRGHLNIAKLLLMYGANVSESAQGGIRPLHEAADNGFVEIVRLLLSYGADPALATYSGSTPLSLAADESTISLLQNHLAEIQGKPTVTWQFLGPATCFDIEETGYNPLEDIPKADQIIENDDLEFEVADVLLPNLYSLQGDNTNDRWILLQDLSNLLKIKSRDALLKQISSPSTSSLTSNSKNVIKEMKMNEFLEQAQCCQFINAGEKINIRASKIALVKYTDKVKQLLNVEKVVIASNR